MRIVMVALVAVMALACVSLAADVTGAPAGAAVKERPAANPDAALAYGKLTKIDGKSLTIASRERGSETTKDIVVKVDDNTKVFTREGGRDAKPVAAKVEDLKVDQNVRAEYSKATSVVSSITIMVRPANAPATPAK